jgi:hypothetical protein
MSLPGSGLLTVSQFINHKGHKGTQGKLWFSLSVPYMSLWLIEFKMRQMQESGTGYNLVRA